MKESKFDKVAIVVSGSRYGFTESEVIDELNSVVDRIGVENVGELIVGDAIGVDAYTRTFAESKGLCLNVYYADWYFLGGRAGLMRNQDMYERALMFTKGALLLAFQNNNSKGTQNMIDKFKGDIFNKPVNLRVYKPKPIDKVSFG